MDNDNNDRDTTKRIVPIMAYNENWEVRLYPNGDITVTNKRDENLMAVFGESGFMELTPELKRCL